MQLDRFQIGRLQRAVEGGGYWQGLSDLRNLRLDNERILKNHYSYVDISKPKSIKVSMTNPKREVDVVVANWYKDADYYIKDDKTYLGVKIFEKGDNANQDRELPPDFPFLSIARINAKDSEVNGILKKMIRFLKTIKGDSGFSDSIKLTSFDFNAICYDIDKSVYSNQNYLDLVITVYNQLYTLSINSIKRNSLKSVDGHELIFRNEDGSENTQKVTSLQRIIYEVGLVIKDIEEENRNLRFAV
jgi:hypothetical protein